MRAYRTSEIPTCPRKILFGKPTAPFGLCPAGTSGLKAESKFEKACAATCPYKNQLESSGEGKVDRIAFRPVVSSEFAEISD